VLAWLLIDDLWDTDAFRLPLGISPQWSIGVTMESGMMLGR